VFAQKQRPWQLSSATQSLALFSPVLALTLLRRRAGQLEVLTGVRTAAANRYHPGVVSVPTLRVAEATAATWLEELTGITASDTVMREVVNLLARKLGAADALELNQIGLTRLHLGAWQGTSVIGEDASGLVTEDLTMFNACVEVVDGSDLIAEETASYNPLLWVNVDRFLKMVETRDVGALDADLDELLFCAYGLCLESAAKILKENALPRH
jgi:hypothetical protein